MEYPKLVEKINMGFKKRKRASSSNNCKIRTRLQHVLGVDNSKFQAKVFSPLITKSDRNSYFSGFSHPKNNEILLGFSNENNKNNGNFHTTMFSKENQNPNLKLLNKEKTQNLNLIDFYKKSSRSSNSRENTKIQKNGIITPELLKNSKKISTEISTANTKNSSDLMKIMRNDSPDPTRIAQFTTSSKKKRENQAKVISPIKKTKKAHRKKPQNFTTIKKTSKFLITPMKKFKTNLVKFSKKTS